MGEVLGTAGIVLWLGRFRAGWSRPVGWSLERLQTHVTVAGTVCRWVFFGSRSGGCVSRWTGAYFAFGECKGHWRKCFSWVTDKMLEVTVCVEVYKSAENRFFAVPRNNCNNIIICQEMGK